MNGDEAANGGESVERVDDDGTVVNGEQSVVEQVSGNQAMESNQGNSSQTCAVCYVPTVRCVPTSQCDNIRNSDNATHLYTGLPILGHYFSFFCLTSLYITLSSETYIRKSHLLTASNGPDAAQVKCSSRGFVIPFWHSSTNCQHYHR